MVVVVEACGVGACDFCAEAVLVPLVTIEAVGAVGGGFWLDKSISGSSWTSSAATSGGSSSVEKRKGFRTVSVIIIRKKEKHDNDESPCSNNGRLAII